MTPLLEIVRLTESFALLRLAFSIIQDVPFGNILHATGRRDLLISWIFAHKQVSTTI